MDIEFHYYMMYLTAVRAGYPPKEARVIAQASQFVDDNSIRFEIDKGHASGYRNYISQTMNILKPKPKLFRIYPLFHFVPGEPKAPTAWRGDGAMHWLNTTPDSPNARAILDAALASENLYRIGIACHAYTDTWAHQNFVGYFADFNALSGPLGNPAPNIGHAEAGHNPDWPALVWQDRRLLNERVDNKARFLEAAAEAMERLATAIDPKIAGEEIGARKRGLIEDLGEAIGDRDQNNGFRDTRIARYRQLAQQNEYAATSLPEYDEDLWFEEAVNEKVRGIRDRSDNFLTRWDPLTDVYTWKDRGTYKQTHWYSFQEAVKAHQDEAWAIVSKTSFLGLSLPEL